MPTNYPKLYSTFIAIAYFIVDYKYDIRMSKACIINVLTGTITVSSIITGFLFTIKSILVTSSGKEYIKVVSNMKSYTSFLKRTDFLIANSFIVVTASLILLALDYSTVTLYKQILLTIWIAITINMLILCKSIYTTFNIICDCMQSKQHS